MIIILERKYFTDRSTIGKLLIDGVFECYILEDVARALGVKIKHQTAIPEGEHLIRITHSNRFKRYSPLVYNRDNWSVADGRGAVWTGIRIHPGNDSQNTSGCLLPGQRMETDRVISSVAAFDPLYKKLFDEIGLTGTIKFRIINNQI